MSPDIYRILADLVLIVHAGYVVFVIVGLLLIWWGGFRGWRWVRNWWFRSAHLGAIAVVVVQAWLGIDCPLTTLEMFLRRKAGDLTYEGGFIAHWLHAILYYDAPAWVFTLGYSLFGLGVVASLLVVRPGAFAAPDDKPVLR